MTFSIEFYHHKSEILIRVGYKGKPGSLDPSLEFTEKHNFFFSEVPTIVRPTDYAP